ncbi:MAG: hypothetical protein FJ149_07505 [Euryarchaeota archaeon]|nr:hypothetical protein [Euryarchaeota archaeon]
MNSAAGKDRLLRVLGAVTALVALLMVLFASALPWGKLDVETKIGTFPVTLRAGVYEYGIDYEANLSGAGLFSGANIPSKIADRKVFLTGLGGFQETIGFVKGSAKEKVVYATSYTWPPPRNGTADTKITMMLRTIPWWPAGIAQEAGFSVELTGAVNVSELRIVKVSFEVHRLVPVKQGDRTVMEDRYKVAYEASPGTVLQKVGDKRSVWGKITIDEDFGNFTLVGKVQLELKDTFGNTNKRQDGTYYELVPPPSEVKLWTMGGDKTVRIGLMMAAFPMSLTAAALLALGAISGVLSGTRPRAARWAWRLCVAGSVLALLAVVFYVLGIAALIELTGYDDWFSFNPQFILAVAGACLSTVPAALLFMVRPLPAPRKAAGKGPGKAGPSVGATSGGKSEGSAGGLSGKVSEGEPPSTDKVKK